MNIIENYYYVIIGIGLFIMFALVGYLVEITKKNKEISKDKNNNIDNIIKINDKKNVKLEIKSEETLIDNDILNK